MTTPEITPEKPVSEFSAAMHGKCPKCHKGDMFRKSSLGFLSQKMNTNCPYCNFQFEVEPGYFYVAMFVGYAMNVALLVTLAVGTYILSGSKNPWLYCAILLSMAFVLSPVNFRYSRVILLYWLTPGVHFDPNRAGKNV